MKSLIFEELLLMSPVERKARRVAFHPQVTAIVGENDTGKSSILKSIYWTLSADPIRQHPKWDDLNVASLLKFSIDDQKFTAVRAGASIALFNAKGACEIVTSQVTRELAPRLARHLGFVLQLKSRQGAAEKPPPAFCFLPFYQDQDPGWSQPWASFAALGQFSDWKREVIAYHSGIRPNEYYELSVRKAEMETAVTELEQERKALSRAFEKLKETKLHRPMVIDRAKYQAAIGELLAQLQALEDDRQKVTTKLSGLSGRKALLQQQAAIAQAALGELDKDYAFIKDDFNEHTNQQDQDEKNARAIIEFIFKRRPAKAQVILGTVSLQEVANPGWTVEMTEKFGALEKKSYDEVAEQMRPFLNAMGS